MMGIILCALLKVLILKEVVMPMPLQENLKNHHIPNIYPKIFLRNFKDIEILEDIDQKIGSNRQYLFPPKNMFITISTNVRRNPSNPIIPFMIPESNTFQKILNSNFEFRKYSTFPTNIDIEISMRNKISKDPFTNTSANTTESIDSIKMRDTLSVPGIPKLKLRNSVCQLYWEPAYTTNHSQIILYQLKGFIIDDNYKDDNKVEHLYYNGTNNYWIIPKNIDQKYQFHVQARNVYGLESDWSRLSMIDLTQCRILNTQSTQYLTLILSIIATVIIIILMCFIIHIHFLYRQKQRKNNKNKFPSLTNRNFARSNLYVSTLQYISDYVAVPEIRQEHITLGNSIENSTSGYVFEGKMKELEGSGTMSVAMKTLQKNASTREKMKLLQEAKLMNSHALYLQDLLSMCKDVAQGCCYLEDFAHRNLACRNCLVSAKNRENCKIGDFDFAKDIYEDDYYQERNVLSVRWMPSESLIGGIFNSQSDVWTFTVTWKIMSLGQQPYFTKTNIEVVDYLRVGGRLPKPFNCPATLYELMLRCWSADDARPNFKVCLENIVTSRSNVDNAIINNVHIGLATKEYSWKSNSSEENRDNHLSCENSNNARTTTTDVNDHLYERLRIT